MAIVVTVKFLSERRKMKTATIMALAIFAFGGWNNSTRGNLQGHSKHCSMVLAGNQRCSMCDGTGFGPNTRGEKGKGHYKCIRCKGTGKI